MSTERRQPTPAERAQSLQGYLCAREEGLHLPESPQELHRVIRNYLEWASDEGHLAMKPHDMFGPLLKRSKSPLGDPPEYTAICGGEKDLKRTGEKLRFTRKDGAWFHFTISVRVLKNRPLELVAYDFELNFPERAHRCYGAPRFVRFDLNQPKHDNESRGLRCHMHPGHDDLIAPAPLMSPLELLDLFVTGLALPERPRTA